MQPRFRSGVDGRRPFWHEGQSGRNIATRLIVLPTGYACAGRAPPMGAVANALHALTLLISRQLVAEIETLSDKIMCTIVPPLCPLSGSPYDFSMTEAHISRAHKHTADWLDNGGLENQDVPDSMRPHMHVLSPGEASA